ncbi:MAG: hypothetical protein NVS1B10_05250 [Candidatus Saccharimonadales bacterium]
MSAIQSLEKSLDDLFVKKGPVLPANAKKAILQYLPYINLALGLLTLFVALGLYNAAHYVNRLVDFSNSLSATYGGAKIATSHLSFMVYVAIAVLVVQALLYIAAFPATRDRKKSGWDLMFYALLINVVYGIVAAFTDFGGAGRLISSLIGSTIGGYFLFQIRSGYIKAPVSPKTKV